MGFEFLFGIISKKYVPAIWRREFFGGVVKMMSYIGLFGSAGGGRYGFKQEEFVATNEPIERRLDRQRYNKKCKY